MLLSKQLPLLSALLLIQVRPCAFIQEIEASRDTIVKINSAGEMMQCSDSLDLLFLIDGSYSVGKGSFERAKHFALKLCEALVISLDKARVGVIQFSSTPRLEFSLDSYGTKEEVLKSIKRLSYKGGSTQTGLALKYVLRKGFPGGRNDTAPRVLVLLSDGQSQGAVEPPASQLKQSGVTVFAVGVKYPRWEELHALASPPSERHVLFADHFYDAVNGLYTALTTSLICSAMPSGCKVESHPCVWKTLETVKELQGNFMCWKGSKGFSPSTSLCPYYRWNRVYTRKHQATCHRTVCPDPCDSAPCENGGTCVSEDLEKYRCVCPVGYGSDPNCAPRLTLDCTVDLLFLVESSTSLSLEGYLRFKSFLRRFLQGALAADTPVNVGLARYDAEVTMEAKIRDIREVSGLLQAVEGMGYGSGVARTGHALRYITRHGFQSMPVFADVRDDLPRVVVLLTGTPSADPVAEAARYARDREVFLIAVGPESMKTQLNDITGNPHRTITYVSPDGLSAKIPELRTKICSVDSQGCPGQALDLIFVLDASASVGRENFARVRDYVRSTSVQFDINRDVTQMGVVAYARQPATAFDLDAHTSGASVLRAVAGVAYLGGWGSSTGSALLHVHDQAMTVTRGARPGVNKAVVVITDGAGGEDAAVPARKIRDNGVSVFAVGVGDAQRDSLLSIAGSEDHVIAVPSYDDLKLFEDALVQMLCADAMRPVNLCRPSLCMNDGICVQLGGSYWCQCRGWEGLHCENRSTPPSTRGDLPRSAGLRRSQRKSYRAQHGGRRSH